MRNVRFIVALVGALATFSQATAAPFGLSYTGRLTLADGKPMPGPVNLTVKFYDDPTAGTLLLTKTIPNTALTQGAFSIELPLSDLDRQTVFGGVEDTWIQISAGGATYPRQKFLAVPYALKVPVNEDQFKYGADGRLAFKVDPIANRVLGADGNGALTWVVGSGLGNMLAGTWDSNSNSKIDEADHAVTADDASELGGELPAFYTNAANISETATRKWLSDTERTKLGGITADADMLTSVYDTDDDGKVNSAVTADNASQFNGQAPSFYLNATNITSGSLPDAQIPAAVARDAELPTAASIASGFAADAVSGDKVHGGTISNFASTGIDDNAAATAVTIDATGKVGIGTASPTSLLEIQGADVANMRLKYADTATGYGTIWFTDGATNKWNMGVWSDSAANPLFQNAFYITQNRDKSDVAVQAYRLLINDAGNVGIGTTNPSRARLETYGVVGNTAAIFGGDGAGVSIIRDWPEIEFNMYYNGGYKSIAAGWGGAIEVNPGNGDFTFRTSDAAAASADQTQTTTDRLYIKNGSGNIGIGTLNPESKLHVESASDATLRLRNTGTAQYSAPTITLENIEVADEETQWQIFASKNTAGAGAPGVYLQFRKRSADQSKAVTPILVDDSNNIILQNGWTNGGETYGDVGIGTSTPGEKLTVAGKVHSTSGGFKFPDGTTQTTAATGGGKVAQVVYSQDNTFVTSTALIPYDDTIPQNTEGVQVLSLAITPTSAASTLMIEAQVTATETTNAGDVITLALFKDADANALSTSSLNVDGGAFYGQHTGTLKFFTPAGSTAAQTFKIRVGLDQAGTLNINGRAGARTMGGSTYSVIQVTELLP